MEDEVYAVLGALLGMLEVSATDRIEPLGERHQRWIAEALRFGDALRERVDAMLALGTDPADERHRREVYPLRRLVDHSIRGVTWHASEKGVQLSCQELQEDDDVQLFIDVSRVDRSLRSITEALVDGVGQGGVLTLDVSGEEAAVQLRLRGARADGASGQFRPSELVEAAWHYVFALQGAEVRIAHDVPEVVVTLPSRPA